MKKFIYDDNIGYVELLNVFGTEKDIANAARVSFDKEDAGTELTKKDIKLIKYLYSHNHTSPFEHVFLKFRIKVPMFVGEQHLRHRTWSFNKKSFRYSSDNIEFYVPKMFRKQSTDNLQASTNEEINPIIAGVLAKDKYSSLCGRAFLLYEELLKEGICREQARGVLPQTTYTHYIATVDMNNFIKFLKLRIHDGVQKETRLMAETMMELALPHFPTILGEIKNEILKKS